MEFQAKLLAGLPAAGVHSPQRLEGAEVNGIRDVGLAPPAGASGEGGFSEPGRPGPLGYQPQGSGPSPGRLLLKRFS